MKLQEETKRKCECGIERTKKLDFTGTINAGV